MPHRCPPEPVPDTVRITSSAREPVWDSDLGIDVAVDARGTPTHRLVAIGDSLTHGFQSGAIYNTDLSFPAIIASELGSYPQFRHPQYPGFGGVPLNIELLVRDLEERFGDEISIWEVPSAAFHIRQHLAEAEHWWDSGPGAATPAMPGISHNLGVYGWDLRDILSRTADSSKAEDRVPFQLVPLVRNADVIAAKRALDSARDSVGMALTPLQAARALGEDGSLQDGTGDGIETLLVTIGANNALGTVIGLCVRWSGDGYNDLKTKGRYDVWRPEHFASEFALVADQVRQIRARHVIFATVPHVTIVPIARGVQGKVEKGSRYFKYYTRPWISDDDFDPEQDAHFTADEARAIDSAIDQYNEAIVQHARAGRNEGRDWRLLDLCGFLDRLASRRYLDDPDVRKPPWWDEHLYELPAALKSLGPVPDSRFFAAGGDGRTAGGLFSLDGVHPTTIAYGLMAQELINVMTEAGVTFYRPDGVTPRPEPVEVDWPTLIARDTLISHPPRSLTSDVALIGWLDQRLDIITRLWGGITGGQDRGPS
jgi:hypothetical protein